MLRLLTLITVTSITSLACADVLNVPGDYSSIGAAIAAANDGDEIHIADGTYTGAANRDLDLGAKNLVIKAVNRGAVTIDCQSLGAGIIIGGGQTPATIIDGLNIVNGTTIGFGGGIYIHGGSEPRIRFCNIVNCHAAGAGGGLAVLSGDAQITSCGFIGNTSDDAGGGMFIGIDGDATIESCEFRQNASNAVGGGGLRANPLTSTLVIRDTVFAGNTTAGDGGGMDISGSGHQVINCHFTDNTADRWGGGAKTADGDILFEGCTFERNESTSGGGLYNSASAPSVKDCDFRDNTSTGFGGGITNSGAEAQIGPARFEGNAAAQGGGGCASSSGSHVSFLDCFFGRNTASNGGGVFNLQNDGPITQSVFYDNEATGLGGAIFNNNASPPMTNLTIIENAAGNNSGAIRNNNGSAPSLRNAILQANTPDQINNSANSTIDAGYSNIPGGWPGPGNIDDDPRIADPASGDFTLLPGSPCIDAADNTALPSGLLTDLAGAPRFIDDPKTADTGLPGGEGGPRITDMGALEYQGLCRVDLNGDGVVDTIDVLAFLGAWAASDPIADWDGSGEINTIDFLAFLNDWVAGC